MESKLRFTINNHGKDKSCNDKFIRVNIYNPQRGDK